MKTKSFGISFKDLSEKAVNYEILQMLYWNMASVNPYGTNSLQAVKGTLGNYLK